MKLKKSVFPVLTRKWRNYLVRKNDSIVIIPHGNLGDLVAIYSGLIELSKSEKNIYLCCRRSLFNQINDIYGLPKNIINLRYFDCNRKFIISKKNELVFERYGKILKLGYFANNKINKYPESFYYEMGLEGRIAEKFIYLKSISKNIENKINDIESLTDGSYIYMNSLSTHCTDNSKILEILKIKYKQPIIYYIDEEKIGLYDAQLDKNTEILITKKYSLALNIELARRANKLILSDAGFFNILIRSFSKFSMILETRKNKNNHNKNIYPIKLSGEKYLWCRDNHIDNINKIDSW